MSGAHRAALLLRKGMPMKKNRNAFFNDMNPMFQNQMMPNYPNMQMPNQMMPANFNMQDIEERLAKIERQITRLDKRISKIESSTISTDDFETNSSNMYML